MGVVENEIRNEILEDEKRLTRYWQRRNYQCLEDRNLINLTPPLQQTDKIKWVDNEPKVFFDTARSLVSINGPQFRLPMTMNFSPEEKQKMNKAERLLIGLWRLQDNRIANNGGVSWLWDLAYWALMGWVADFTVVRKGENGEPEFISDLWDITTVYPQWAENKLNYLVRSYEVDVMTATAMAEDLIIKGKIPTDFIEPKPEDKPKVINWWCNENGKVWNAIMIAGQVVKPKTLQKKLDHIPVHVNAIGLPDRMTDDSQIRQGESIVAANRDMYAYKNTMISLMATILAETAYPNIVTKTRSGAPPTKPEDMKGYGAMVNLRIEDSIDLLKHAATPTEANYLLSYVGQQIQKGSLPASVYGNLPFEVSGFALSQLLAGIKYKIGPYLNAMQSIMSRISSDWLAQYKNGKFGEITLSTTNPYDLRRGLVYVENYNTDDVPEHLFVEVTIPITSQFDKTQAILNARQALTPPQLFSRETLWETELGVQDKEQEMARIRQDQVFEDPFIRQIEIVQELKVREETYIAQGMYAQAMAVKRYREGLEMQLGMRQGIIQTPGQTINAPKPPPSMAPPEMTSSPNPDQLNAMTGKAPPSPNRPVSPPPFGVSNTVNLPSAQRGSSKIRVL